MMGDKGEQGKMCNGFIVGTMGNNRKMTPLNGDVRLKVYLSRVPVVNGSNIFFHPIEAIMLW